MQVITSSSTMPIFTWKISFTHLDEPFAVVHGRALQAIRKDREREREKMPSTPSRTAAQVTDEIKRCVQKDIEEKFRWVNELEEWNKAKQAPKKPSPLEGPLSRKEFDRMWISSGLATIQRQGTRGQRIQLKW